MLKACQQLPSRWTGLRCFRITRHSSAVSVGRCSLLLPLLFVGGFIFSACSPEKSGSIDIRRDHEAISRILDAAVLSDSPSAEFKKALTVVRSYASVDSAWIDGANFYVKFKSGGIVTWTAPPHSRSQGQH
jgi:hypothetical protein